MHDGMHLNSQSAVYTRIKLVTAQSKLLTKPELAEFARSLYRSSYKHLRDVEIIEYIAWIARCCQTCRDSTLRSASPFPSFSVLGPLVNVLSVVFRNPSGCDVGPQHIAALNCMPLTPTLP